MLVFSTRLPLKYTVTPEDCMKLILEWIAQNPKYSMSHIPFDSNYDEGVFSEFSDGKDHDFDGSEALMCNANDMEYYYLSVGNSNIVSERQIEDIIPLKKAADILNSYMTNSIKFDVANISLNYSNMIVDNSISDYQTEARPAWKFELKNGNDDLIYKVFVDVESGDCHDYTF